MRNYVGLDVSLKTISICILDEKGKRLFQGEVESTPKDVDDFLKKTGIEIELIGLERIKQHFFCKI